MYLKNLYSFFINPVKNLSHKCVHSCGTIFNKTKKFSRQCSDFCRNTRDYVVYIKQDLSTNHKKYSAISSIVIKTLIGASVTLIFGVGLISIINSMLPKLLTKLICGMFIAVPTVGILSGNIESYHLSKSHNVKNNNLKRILETSTISLVSIATASLTTLLGLGIISTVKLLFPKLYVLSIIGTAVTVPLTSIASSIAISNTDTFDFDKQSIDDDNSISIDDSFDTESILMDDASISANDSFVMAMDEETPYENLFGEYIENIPQIIPSHSRDNGSLSKSI